MTSVRAQRDGKIELVRFLAALSIAMYHFEWIYIGHPVLLQHFYIWVELFFLISGFFLYFSMDNEDRKGEYRSSSFGYVFSQLKKIYPLYLTGFLFTYVVTNMVEQLPLGQWAAALWGAKWEILLGVMYGFGGSVYNKGGAPEQISALLLGSLILHFLITRHRPVFVNVIAPLTVIIGFGRIINIYGNMSQWMAFDGYINIGLLRGVADMCAGALCAAVLLPFFRKIKQRRVIVAGVIIPCIFIVFLIWGRDFISSYDLILYVFLFGFLITALYAWQLRVPERINVMMLYLGRLSYPLFLFHYGMLILLKNYWPGVRYRYGAMMFLFMTLSTAAVILYLQRKVKCLIEE